MRSIEVPRCGRCVGIASASALLWATGWLWAQATPPGLMQLQGRLTDSSGQPITSTTRDLRVEYWDSAVGGALLGASNVVDPAITNGIYAVALAPPAGVFASNATVFMETAVGNGAAGADGAFEVLSPRIRVLASAYALNADTLDGRDSSSFASTASAFVQDGNSFGGAARLGTNDAFPLVIETGGVEQLRVLANGNVAIGTTTPGASLDIYRGGDAAFLRVFGAGDADNFAGLDLRSDEATDKIWQFAHKRLPADLNKLITYYFDGASWLPRMAIDTSGRVGVGTTTPASTLTIGTSGNLANGLTLGPGGAAGVYTDPSGWLVITNQNGVGKLTLFDSYARADENFIVENMLRGSGGNTPVRVDTGLNVLAGRVGIGTAAPGRPLHIDNAVEPVIRLHDSDHPAGTFWELQQGAFVDDMFGIVRYEAGVAVPSESVVVRNDGNVGIGTTTPGARLTVVAGATTDTLGANGASDGFDIAEAISSADDVEVGDLVSADPGTSQSVVKSRAPYDPALLGVITSQPAIAIGATDGNRHIALAGRVAVKVSGENGPVRRGDLLTSSSRPGYAMKATGPGRVVGTALGEFSGEKEGRVVVYVSPGWWDGGRTEELTHRVTDLSSRLEEVERENDELRERLARIEALVEAGSR